MHTLKVSKPTSPRIYIGVEAGRPGPTAAPAAASQEEPLGPSPPPLTTRVPLAQHGPSGQHRPRDHSPLTHPADPRHGPPRLAPPGSLTFWCRCRRARRPRESRGSWWSPPPGPAQAPPLLPARCS